jgi:hypothetical protein
LPINLQKKKLDVNFEYLRSIFVNLEAVNNFSIKYF